EAIGLPVDVQDEASIQTMTERAVGVFGRLDILVNNAGIAISNPPQDTTAEEWHRVLDVNLSGVFLCSKAAYPHMVVAGGGKILNIGSMFSIFAQEALSSYAASKGGVVQLPKSLAPAWAKDSIQVNAILPGWVRTELTAGAQTNPERHAAIVGRI